MSSKFNHESMINGIAQQLPCENANLRPKLLGVFKAELIRGARGSAYNLTPSELTLAVLCHSAPSGYCAVVRAISTVKGTGVNHLATTPVNRS